MELRAFIRSSRSTQILAFRDEDASEKRCNRAKMLIGSIVRLDQTEKNSARAYVFRFALKFGRRSIERGCEPGRTSSDRAFLPPLLPTNPKSSVENQEGCYRSPECDAAMSMELVIASSVSPVRQKDRMMQVDRRPLFDRLAVFPRLGLANLPTPLEPMKRLTAHLGGPRLWVKREDATGLGFGGNKLRKLDYVLHEAISSGADTIVSGGVVQSNSQRQVAAVAAKLGLTCHLAVYQGRLEPPG
jgi:hypothetical protein